MKKIILTIIGLCLLIPFVFAHTSWLTTETLPNGTNITYKEYHTFTRLPDGFMTWEEYNHSWYGLLQESAPYYRYTFEYERYNLSQNPPQINETIDGNLLVTDSIIATNVIEADEVIVHSDGFRDLTFTELKTIILNLNNLENGEINKSRVPTYYKSDDGQGIRMWRMMIDVVVNLAKHTYQKVQELENRVTVNENDLQLIKDNGWTGTFTAGQTCTVNKGIITGCV